MIACGPRSVRSPRVRGRRSGVCSSRSVGGGSFSSTYGRDVRNRCGPAVAARGQGEEQAVARSTFGRESRRRGASTGARHRPVRGGVGAMLGRPHCSRERSCRSPSRSSARCAPRTRHRTCAVHGAAILGGVRRPDPLLIGFAVFLFGSSIYMETVWHYSALRTGLGIASAPLLAGVLSVSAGRIQHHFGQLAPTLLGVLTMSLAGLLWRLDAGPSRHYVTEMLPSLLLSGASGGLTVAPLFAQTSALASERATTGSALLNVSRQLGSAIGIAVVVAATGSGVGLSGFRFVWTAPIRIQES